MNKILFVKDLVDFFKLQELTNPSISKNNPIELYGLNRAGLELCGYNLHDEDRKRRIVLLSLKESILVQSLEYEEKIKRYKELVQLKIPMIILTSRFSDPDLISVANKYGCPIFLFSELKTTIIMQLIFDFQDRYFCPEIETHASLVNVFGKGVLIKGPSGIGKSEVVLDLMKKNHLFVGDDRICITQKGNSLYGRGHELLKNLIEIRGLGIINLAETYGHQYILDSTKIDVIINLISLSDEKYKEIDRLGLKIVYENILNNNVAKYNLPVARGRNMSDLIETTVAKYKWQLSLKNPNTSFEDSWNEKLNNYLKSNKE